MKIEVAHARECAKKRLNALPLLQRAEVEEIVARRVVWSFDTIGKIGAVLDDGDLRRTDATRNQSVTYCRRRRYDRIGAIERDLLELFDFRERRRRC